MTRTRRWAAAGAQPPTVTVTVTVAAASDRQLEDPRRRSLSPPAGLTIRVTHCQWQAGTRAVRRALLSLRLVA